MPAVAIRHFALLLLAIGCAFGVADAAFARPLPPITAAQATVAVAGRPVMRFRTTLGGASPEQRASIVAARLQDGLLRGYSPSALTVSLAKPNAILRFGDITLCYVTPQEARVQNSLPDSLAQLWAHRLRALFAAPLLTVSKTRVVIPLGETRAVTFGGLLGAPEGWSSDDKEVTVTFDPTQRRAVLRGEKTGDARLIFVREGATVAVDAVVRPYAGRLPARAEGWVTGYVAPADLVQQRAMAAARQALILEPGAQVALEPPTVPTGLRPGHRMHLSVPVHLTGPRHLPVSGRVPVTVHNAPFPRTPTPRLFYSNKPESVKGYGSLFVGRLSVDEPARLLYHHENSTRRSLTIVADVVNPGPDPVRLHITEGTAPPSADAVQAGHEAARDFLRNARNGVGYIAELPPRTVLAVASHVLKPTQVASGVLCLRQLSGSGDCLVQVRSDNPHAPTVRPPDGTAALSRTVFGPALKTITADFRIGGPWTFIRLGSATQAHAARYDEDGFGDYGISYEIALDLSNPSDEARRVGLVFEAASGKARGVFVVDGKLVETPTLNAHQEILLEMLTLPAGSTRKVHVSTLPLSGSAYPARLVVRDIPRHSTIRPGMLLRVH